MPLTKLDVKAIKDGTDGQIITWDASAKANAVGPGTATQVLTSNVLVLNLHFKTQ